MADENDMDSGPFEVSGPPQPTPKSMNQQVQEDIFKPDDQGPPIQRPWFTPAPAPTPNNPPRQQGTPPNPIFTPGPINVPNQPPPPPWVNVTPVADNGGDGTDTTQQVAFDSTAGDQGLAPTTGGDTPQFDPAVTPAFDPASDPAPDPTADDPAAVAMADSSGDGTT